MSDMAMDGVMNIWLDQDLESYAQFYDHALAKKLEELTRGTTLERSAVILCGTWKAASNSMRLPWLSVASIQEVGLGAAIDTKSRRGFLRTLSAALQYNLVMPKGQWQLLENQIQLIAAAYLTAEKETKKTYNKELVWKAFLTLKKPDGSPVAEFPMAIWGSQQIGFGATYHAYENFMRTVIEMFEVKAGRKAGYRVDYRNGKFQKHVAEHLDPSISDGCIDDDKIKIAKEIRNSLAHQGGYVEVDPKTPDGFNGYRVIDNIVQITATNNRELFLLLQDRAHVFAEAALKKL